MITNLVSIITPVYNAERFISATISSVQNQTYTQWEMILVDDCSSDQSVEIIQSFCAQDKRIKLIQLPQNSGAAEARNTAIEHTQGKLLAFCDSDDVWQKTKLEEQVSFMQTTQTAISYTEYDMCSEDLSKVESVVKVPAKIDYIGYLKNTIIGMSTSMINLAITGPIEFVNIRTRQDTYLWISLLKKGFIARGLQKNLVQYRVRNNSISSDKRHAAKQVWYLYYELEKLGLLRSSYYFMNYAFNAVKKRIG